jgi:IMP dehydrogenase
MTAHKNAMMEGLTFDDILLLPGYADFWREEVSLSVQMHNSLKLNLPVFSSPMDTVTEENMAVVIAQNGGIGIVHRSMSGEAQAALVQRVKVGEVQKNSAVDAQNRLVCGAAVGVGEDFEARVKALIEAEVDLFVVDTAHGHAKFIIDAVKFIKTQTKIPVMAGNITTFQAAMDLMDAGANILRVGMGPGSICTTRIVTGVGVPQLTAISEVKRAITESKKHVTLVADGGIKQIGDIAKAIAFGADAVMLGGLLAGFDQSPGEVVEAQNQKYKVYRGMGSAKAMSEGSAARYGQAGIEASKLVSEGVEGLVKYKGDVNNFLYQIGGGLRSSCYYIGAKTISEFQSKVQFVKITPASFGESMPHSISITQGGASFLGK